MKAPCASHASRVEFRMSTASRSGKRIERAARGSAYLSQIAWPAWCCQKTWQSHEHTVRCYPIPTQFLKIKSWRKRDVSPLSSVKSYWASPFEYMKISLTRFQTRWILFNFISIYFKYGLHLRSDVQVLSLKTSALRHACEYDQWMNRKNKLKFIRTH